MRTRDFKLALVLRMLLEKRQGSDGWVSFGQIQEECELSRCTSYRSVEALEDAGFPIQRQRGFGTAAGLGSGRVRCAFMLVPRKD